MTLPDSADVVVIGGGPGGALAATYLAQAGRRVVLLEKQRFPRYAVGESLIPDFWRYCDVAGVSERIQAEGFVRKAGGTIDWNGGSSHIAFDDFGYSRPALHVERDRFDAILLEQAGKVGATLYTETAVNRVQIVEGGEKVRVEYRSSDGRRGVIHCRYVVDASGQNGLLGRQWGLREQDPAFRFMAVWGYFSGSDYLTADGGVYPAQRVLDIPPTTYVTNLPALGNWGWCWHIMLRRQTSVGFILPMDTIQTVRGEGGGWERFFLEQIEHLPRLRRLLQPAAFVPGSVRMIRSYSFRSTQVAGPGYYLIGDAAGFVDPVFSMGVVLAMYSAFAAAWAIDASLEEPDRAEEYQTVYSDQMQGRLDISRSLALPGYGEKGQFEAQAQQVMELFSGQSLALMQAAAHSTARPSDHSHPRDNA